MKNIFNSKFENALRILIILDESSEAISIERIISIDYIALYNKEFSLSYQNIHGDNDYHFSEYVSKRDKAFEAIKFLTITNYIKPIFDKNGFTYITSNKGKDLCKSMNTDYSDSYKHTVKKTLLYFKDYSDKKIIQLINQNAISFAKKGD